MSPQNHLIDELIHQIQIELKSIGLCDKSIAVDKASIYNQISKYFKKRKCLEYSESILADFLHIIEKRECAGEISHSYSTDLKLGVYRIIEYHDTGSITWRPHRPAKYNVTNVQFLRCMDTFKMTLKQNHHTNSIMSDIRKFNFWLEGIGISDYRAINALMLQDYLSVQNKSIKQNSMRNLIHHLRKYFLFLFDEGIVNEAFEKFLSNHIPREKKIFPVANPDDVTKVLKAADTETAIGKRDYAMFMLAVVLGLRSIDIVTLKLTDIDWINGKINISQSKTGNPLSLPLISSVGESIKNYILHGRPQSNYSEIFLRAKAPFCPLTTVGIRYNHYLKGISSISRSSFDGKSFHSLRRAVGTKMVIEGVPVMTMAQVLGHSDLNSTRPYIALDIIHLKECPLSLAGIEPTGGVYGN